MAKGRQSLVDRGFEVLVTIIVTIIALTCILPILNIFSLSLSSARAVNSNEVTFLPVDFTLDAYESVFTNGALLRSMWYTIKATLLYVSISMFMTILCAYPLSHRDLVGRKPLWVFVLFTMYFAGGMIPSYLLVNDLGLINTMWSLVLPGMVSTYNMILMRTFFSSIPAEMKEAAYIDGANDADILWRVVLPLSKAMLATIALFYAVSRWNAVTDGMLYISEPSKYILQVRLKNIILSAAGLNELMSEGANVGLTIQPLQIRSAALVFSLLPVLVVYPFLQKYFVRGVMIGAVKG
ncbi:MAG: carbohydrate ABC transporter permease [Clostridiales bacterium]|nr:carbohydrate ABC transporter permease [Clostridiales bacterium]